MGSNHRITVLRPPRRVPDPKASFSSGAVGPVEAGAVVVVDGSTWAGRGLVIILGIAKGAVTAIRDARCSGAQVVTLSASGAAAGDPVIQAPIHLNQPCISSSVSMALISRNIGPFGSHTGYSRRFIRVSNNARIECLPCSK